MVELPMRLRSRRRAFFGNRSGGLSIMTAILLIPLTGFIAAAIDYGRAYRFKSRVASVADSASLAATKFAADKSKTSGGMTQDEIIAQAKAMAVTFFKAELTRLGDGTLADPTADVTLTNGVWATTLNYTGTVPTPFASLIGVASLPLAGAAVTKIDPGLPVLDIAMCVDSTGSMQPTLDAVKTNAMGFYNNLNTQLSAKGMAPFPLVRVRMIYFKDYGGYGNLGGSGNGDPDSMYASAFFPLPDQTSNFDGFVSPQLAYGGGDAPESGLECLNEAMDSQWSKVGDTPAGFTRPITDAYSVIVIWTDTSSHPPSYADSLANPSYPPANVMPRDYAGLLAKWNDATKIDQRYKQILFFGDPNLDYPDNYGGTASGWMEVEKWPKFTVGGTLTEANASMVEVLATGIANSGKGLRITN